MSLRSVVLTPGGANWRVPPGVSSGWVNAVGGGGGGQAGIKGTAEGGSAAGSGEFCLGMPIPLVPGSIMTFGPGAGSVGGTSAVDSTNANATTFAGFSVLPGASVANASGSNASGGGGGPRGGAPLIAVQEDGFAGTSESPTAFGGASGGTGEGLAVSSSGAGGQQIGQYAAPRVPNTAAHPSGSGGCGVFGAGGLGVSTGSGNNGGGYGTGSSGVAGDATGSSTAGNGAGGVVMIFYLAP